jgi:TrpR-related protein YerC/YecD
VRKERMMKKLRNKDVDILFEAILTLKTVEECYTFFEDACTIKEIMEISQRLKAARMLRDGVNYVDISKETGMSTATISRVNKCLEYGNGGYNTVLDRLEEKNK